jgi:hypothetical protein
MWQDTLYAIVEKLVHDMNPGKWSKRQIVVALWLDRTLGNHEVVSSSSSRDMAAKGVSKSKVFV